MLTAANRRIRTLLSASLIAGLFLTFPIGGLVQSSQAATTVSLSDSDKLAFNKANASYTLSATKTAAAAGKVVNDIVVYKNVGSFGGVSIDCAVTTVAIASGSISDYDNNGSATTTGTYIDNFQLNTVGGEATFKFEFFKSGTYTVPGSGVPVVLQNVKITSIDLDSSNNGFQYTDFTGFQKYSMMSPTNLGVQPLTSPNRVRFIATKSGARSSVPEDQVLVKYDAVQTIQMNFGNTVAGSTNYFGLVFGGWPGTGSPVEYTNAFNSPPTSTDITHKIPLAPAATILPLSDFGNYADADNNPFNQVKIATISGGTLEYSSDGSTWATVNANQVISVADIDLGRVRFTPSSGSNATVTFYVQDGLDYSLATNTLTLVPLGAAQTITFNNPGTKAVSAGSFSSGATASSNLPVTLSSSTTGICTVSGLNIVPVAAGTCVITATQAGDGTWPAALPVNQSFLITSTVLTTQTLTLLLASPANKGTTVTPTVSSLTNKVTSSITAINNLNVLTSLTPSICTVSSGVISYLAAGTCTIEANNPGDTTYAPANSVTANVTVQAPASTTQPIPTTLGAHTVNTSSATLTGMVDVNGVATTYRFCYSTSTTSLKATGTGSAPSGVTCVTSGSLTNSAEPLNILSANISGLSTRTTYYYNISAWNSSNTAQYGEIFKFSTWSTSKGSRKRPMVVTNAVAAKTTTTATLSGTGTADDSAVSSTTPKVSFCVSTSPAFSATTYSISCNIVGEPLTEISTDITTSGTTVTRVTNSVLSPGTLYYYQASIKRIYNGSSTIIYGNIVPFTTNVRDQSVTTSDATNVSTTTAVLNGSVNAYGSTTTNSFIITSDSHTAGGVLDTSLLSPVSATPSTSSITGGVSIAGNVNTLVDGTRYYFQARATRDGSTYVYGPVKSFVTGTPTVRTLAPSNLSSTASPWSVDLNGYVNPNGTTATLSFCYLASNSAPTPNADGSLAGCTSVSPASGTDTSTVTAAFTKNVISLTAGVTYYYQAVASSNGGTRVSYGEVLTFTTVAPPAAVTTGTPSAITSTGATLAGAATSNGAATNGAFCVSASNTLDDNNWLINCEFGVQDNESTLATNASNAAITGTVTGLLPLTTYYFQATAASTVGTGLGVVSSFTTLAGAPTPVTLGATGVTGSAARMNGTVNPGGAETTVKFNYITDSVEPGLDVNGKITQGAGGSGTVVTVTVSGTVAASASTTASFYDLTGLSTSNIYYYQIEVTNSSGTAYGDVVSFSVSDPYATTGASELVTSTTARVNGTGFKNGATNPTAELCVSTSSGLDVNGGLGGCTSSTPVTLTNTSHPLQLDLTGLTPGTVYYFQASATDTTTGSTNYGAVGTFTTRFVVNFDGNGSSDTMTAMSAITSTALTTNTMARSGYTFTGWNTAADGSGTPYADGANFAFTSNATMYAQWSSSAIIVTYNPNSGSVSPTTATFTGTALTLPTPTRSGYTFNGWFTASSGGTSIGAAGASYTPSVSITIYAQWTAVNSPAPVYVAPAVTITWPTPTKIKYPTALSGAQLNAIALCQGAIVSGTYTYVPALGALLTPGSYTLTVTFTPNSGACSAASSTTQLVVEAPNAPTITWPTPTPTAAPLSLSTVQLNATCSVPGALSYEPALGTVLQPGTYTLKTTCVPTDSNIPSVSATVTMVVEKLTPKITWSDPLPIIIGTPLTTTQLNAVLSVPGSCVYTPALSALLPVGIQTLSVTCTPTNATLYNAVTTTVKIEILPVSKSTIAPVQIPLEKSTTLVTPKEIEGSQAKIVKLGSCLTSVTIIGARITYTPNCAGSSFVSISTVSSGLLKYFTIPVTVVATPKATNGTLSFEVFYAMNSYFLDASNRKVIENKIAEVSKKLTSKSVVTISIVGWVQPTKISPNVQFLSTNRATAVSKYMKAKGFLGTYLIKSPGHDKDNIPSARHATVEITWTNSK